MSKTYRTFLAVYIFSILTPFITSTFFHHTAGFFLSVGLFTVSFIFLVISTGYLRLLDLHLTRRKHYGRAAFAAVLTFFCSYYIQIGISDWIFFKAREEKLTNLVNQIQASGRIKSITNGLKSWQIINGTVVRQDSPKVAKSPVNNGVRFVKDVLHRDKISKADYVTLTTALIGLNLMSFTVLADGTISFTIDGMLDNCQGIAYSPTGIRPAKNDCGDIIRWDKIGENWYAWGTT